MGIDVIMIIVWAVAAVAFALIEFATPQLVTVWFAIGAIVSLILAVLGVNPLIQVLIFVVLSVALFLATKKLVRKMMANDNTPLNADRLKGKVAVVLEEITPISKGTVRINNQTWSAASNTEMHPGDKVVITGFEGNKVVVEKIEDIEL